MWEATGARKKPAKRRALQHAPLRALVFTLDLIAVGERGNAARRNFAQANEPRGLPLSRSIIADPFQPWAPFSSRRTRPQRTGVVYLLQSERLVAATFSRHLGSNGGPSGKKAEKRELSRGTEASFESCEPHATAAYKEANGVDSPSVWCGKGRSRSQWIATWLVNDACVEGLLATLNSSPAGKLLRSTNIFVN